MAPAAKSKTEGGITPEQIFREVQEGKIAPFYLLMGEESYYIDRIADFLLDRIIPAEQRDFDLATFFGAEAQVSNVIQSAREFPMMSQRRVVILREAQALDSAKAELDKLELYLRQPQPSTVLIVCYKEGTLDKRSKMMALANKVGVVYTSNKLRDYELPKFITSYAQRKQVAIAPEAAQMMADYIGTDLSRIASEMDKLLIALPQGSPAISREMVMTNIGMSKEFNIFELTDALANKDVRKTHLIIKYFDKNQKENPPMKYLPLVYKLFAQVLMAYYSPDKSENGIANFLGISPWQARKNILPAMRHYSGVKAMNILSQIRRTDGRTKGIDNPSIPQGDLIKELMHYILH